MSIEVLIANLTVALNENTAAHKAAGGATSTPAADKPKAEKPAAKDKPAADKPKHTREEVTAALTEVKEKKGAPAAKTIITDIGGTEKMKDIPESKFDAVYEAAKAAVAEDDDGM